VKSLTATRVIPQATTARTADRRFSVLSLRKRDQQVDNTPKGGSNRMSILWIILIVILVLALLGFFSRGRW
jgi:hypothetical protein